MRMAFVIYRQFHAMSNFSLENDKRNLHFLKFAF